MARRYIVSRRNPKVRHIRSSHDYAPLCASLRWTSIQAIARTHVESTSKTTRALPLCGDCRRKAERIVRDLHG